MRMHAQLPGSSCPHCSHFTERSPSPGKSRSVPQVGQNSKDPVRRIFEIVGVHGKRSSKAVILNIIIIFIGWILSKFSSQVAVSSKDAPILCARRVDMVAGREKR